MDNDILDRSMQAAKNLMLIEIKDRKAALNEKLDILRNDGTLETLNKQCQEIRNSEKSEIISNTPWLQKLIEATQDAMFRIGADCILDIDDQECVLNDRTSALTDTSNIITATKVLYNTSVHIKENGTFNFSYSINRLLMPWASDTFFEIENYDFQPEDAAVFLKRKEIHTAIRLLEEERCILTDKSRNTEDILLRVETDLLLKQIKSDAIGESSIDTIKLLMGKYLSNNLLPEGMSLIEKSK